jgi:hypothetical protein
MAQRRGVSIIADPGDAIAGAEPARWAVEALRNALATRSLQVSLHERVEQAAAGDLCIVAAGAGSKLAREILKSAGGAAPDAAESLALAPGKAAGRQVLLACGFDARGLVYAVLDLADRVSLAADPIAALDIRKAAVERPANRIRSVQRLFCSDVEDKPWFNDRAMWPEYLTMLAAQRFNRFNLSLGIGYDFLRNVTDGYFLFAYPFLLPVPGYDVRATNLSDAERDRNLEMLRYISEQAVARGLEFQLGIWMHGYEWEETPQVNHVIKGLDAKTHAPYCRDALAALLKACPKISGITFRVHGESGVPEESYQFWGTVFEGVVRSGRKVEIDMHAKGMDQRMIDVALATGMPVNISPKYWAEHMGLPYHQAEIRELERPRGGQRRGGLMALSAGSRSFLRYGYGDLLREDRRFGVLHRIWPGTQRLLLWGDPVTGAAYSRAFSFCGSAGVEIMEPLSFKGRRGSGLKGDRGGYADASLRSRWDWQKYAYSFRVWGRLLYNPDAEPDCWRRYMRAHFKAGARAAEDALASASRILPLVTTAHAPSAGNNDYWPEVYTNQPVADPARKHHYVDTPAPRVFGNVSPLDPQVFSRINDFADEILAGDRSGKYSPIEAAQWLEDLADASEKNLKQVAGAGPEFRRFSIDVALQIGTGRFFAARFRSGVLYRIYERTGDRAALEEALKAYRRARTIFGEMANLAKGVYVSDITVGELPHLRGHWLDRLPAMDADIGDMAKKLETAAAVEDPKARAAVAEALGRPRRISLPARHTPPARFRPRQPLDLELALENAPAPVSVRLYYRHVNQAERYQSAPMAAQGNRYRAAIPAAYTDTQYPLEYYFELKQGADRAWLYPGFSEDRANQPYFVVRRA